MNCDQRLKEVRAALRAYYFAMHGRPDRKSIIPKIPDLEGAAKAAEELAESFEQLDGWLVKGAPLPKAWSKR